MQMQPIFYLPTPTYNNIQDTEKARFIQQYLLLSAINEQFQLTQHLIQNQYRITEQLNKQKKSSDSGQTSIQDMKKQSKKNDIDQEEDFQFVSSKQGSVVSSLPKQAQQEVPLTRLRVKKVLKYDFDYDPESQAKESKKCETKNIIKNFTKSLFNFVRMHSNYLKRVLESQNVSEEDFMKNFEEVQGKVNTIFQLRQLWNDNPYNKIFRIISAYYLRRYSHKHIFHSRIFNHQIHLKYRQKLLQSVEKPNEFTNLKDF